jgi:hypothetical protein
VSDGGSGTPSDHNAARQPRRAAGFLRRMVLGVAGVAVVGFASSVITRGPAERATRRNLELVYRGFLPNAPPLNWIKPEPLVTWPGNPFRDDPRRWNSPVRYWLFAPRCTYSPQDRRLFGALGDRPYLATGWVVTRVPLPFVVRVHYWWSFTMREDQQTQAKLGLTHGAMDVGVVTYLGLFGVPIALDHYPMYAWGP